MSFPHRMQGVIDDAETIRNPVLYYITIGAKLYMVSEEADGSRHL